MSDRTVRQALAAAALGLVALPVLSTSANAEVATPPSAFVFAGKGDGHGVGLAQDSAEALARIGATREAILDRFYPGTKRSIGAGAIRVLLQQVTSGHADVIADDGLEVVGKHVAFAPGSTLRISKDASGYHVLQLGVGAHAAAVRAALGGDAPAAEASPTTTASAEPSPTDAPSASPSASPSVSPATTPSASVAPPTTVTRYDSPQAPTLRPGNSGVFQLATNGHHYRGDLLLRPTGGLALVNALDVESYLAGLAEMPDSAPTAALEAQIIAARSYALHSRAVSQTKDFDLCADASCQTYLGVEAERPRHLAAIRATKGAALTYQGEYADAVYSENAGGVTADSGEAFDLSPQQYLPAGVIAPGPIRAWTRSVTSAELASRLHYPGSVTSAAVFTRGPSGRVTSLSVTGSAGPRVVNGMLLRSELGLPSTLFSLQSSAASGTASIGVVQLPATELPTSAAPDPQIAAPETASQLPSLDADRVATATILQPPVDTPLLRWTAALLLVVVPLDIARRQGRARRLQGGGGS